VANSVISATSGEASAIINEWNNQHAEIGRPSVFDTIITINPVHLLFHL